MNQRVNLPAAPPAARFIGALAGFVFAGIGLTVLIFLWSASWNAWDSPPLVFRVFGSFIAIGFVGVGGGIAFSVLRGRQSISLPEPSFMNPAAPPAAPESPAAPPAYECPNCGAPLARDADVSPLGDVKCTFCSAWFNIHHRRP